MGLLDSYPLTHTGYGGQVQGLFDVLRMLQQAPYDQPPGFPALNNQPSPLDNAQWPQGPVGAPQPGGGGGGGMMPSPPQMLAPGVDPERIGASGGQMAYPQAPPLQMPMLPAMPPQSAPNTAPQMPGAPPAPPAMSGPGMGDRAMAGFQGFVNAGSPLQALGNLIGGFATGQRTDADGVSQHNANLTYRALVAAGASPQEAVLAQSNPAIMKDLFERLRPKLTPHNVGDTATAFNPTTGKFEPGYTATKVEKRGPNEDFVVIGGGNPNQPRTATPITGLPPSQPKIDDVSGMRKEVTALPEVKRYSEAAPIFRSMVESSNKDSAAADLDFVYGVAKIFDPDSVVREGEMKLVGKAQSIPEDVKGFIKRAAMGEGRLTPEARHRILEVAQTRMNELRGAYDTRVNPYSDIAKRNNMNPADVLPSVVEMPKLPEPPKAATVKPQFGDVMDGYRFKGGDPANKNNWLKVK